MRDRLRKDDIISGDLSFVLVSIRVTYFEFFSINLVLIIDYFPVSSSDKSAIRVVDFLFEHADSYLS